MKHLKNHRVPLAVGTFLLFLFTSCAHSRKIAYFHDLDDTAHLHIQDSIKNFEATIQPGDILDIYVAGMSAQSSAVFNLGNVVPAGVVSPGAASGQGAPVTGDLNGATSVRGYKVDKDGTIDFPVLGKITVDGFTTSRLRDTLKNRLDDGYLKFPVVNVRFLNYKITILGEVVHPASSVISGERATIVDAIGMAGDLTLYGKRDNVLVIREEGGRRAFARLDLTSSKVFNSPYYFLKQNDIVYVEPTHARVVASDDRTVRLVSVLGTIAGLTISILLLFKL